MPQLGEIGYGPDLGYKSHGEYIYHACIDCGKERWVQFPHKKPKNLRCNRCAGLFYQGKGGRSKTKRGYILVKLRPDDFFYSMAKHDGYVFEHRLIVAKALGRCLHRWEIVHHKKGFAKDDNRYPETLQLVSDDRHNQITILENRIKYLEGLLRSSGISLNDRKKSTNSADLSS